ncbi:MAG: EAL domain-containing protein [Acidobacteriia bacterium]|nr:EAL domain-containing protein [Terriglobia bacterium]
MIEESIWGLLCVLAALVGYQQFRMYQLRQAAKHRDELFEIVTENAADMIALVDVKGRRLYNSPAYKKILGYSPAELSETSAFEQIHPDDRFKVLEAAREARSTGLGKRLEYRIRHRDGTWRVLESVASTIRNEKGEVAKLVIVNRDITQRKQAEEQLEHNTFHDTLTGLSNRRLFLDRLQHLFLRSQRNPDDQFAVMFVDIDHFKDLNETMGNAVGDAVIIEIGRRLSACVRDTDMTARPVGGSRSEEAVSRFGGDEFGVLLDAVTDPSDAMRVAQRIQTEVTKPFLVKIREVRASASVGIALSTKGHERAEDLLHDASVAVRRAKGLGGGRCEVFDEAMHVSAMRRLRLETELKTAIEKRQFRVHYQPVMSLENKRLLGFEALLRWQHPAHGLISPMTFLEVAEDTGLLVSIGHWLISEACQQLLAWQMKDAMEPVRVAVNLSSRQLSDSGLISDLRLVLQETGVDPSWLQLELSESVAMSDARLSSGVFSQLRQLGTGIILDRFGKGRSSFSQLRYLPIDALKIDRSLVSEMLTSRSACDIVELIITLAHKLNLKAIAEGIETGTQLAILRDFECDFGQGYLFSRPLDPEAAQQFMRQQRVRGNHAQVP